MTRGAEAGETLAATGTTDKGITMTTRTSWTMGCVLAIASAMAPTIAMASPVEQGNMYVGFQFSQLTLDLDDLSDDAEGSAAIGRFGFFVADRVAIEGRLGIGLSDDSVEFDDDGFMVDVDVDLDRLQGLYAVGYLPLRQQASLYGLLGYTDARATITGSGVSDSEADSGLSYGVGAEFHPSDRFALNLEYTQYLDESDYELSAISAGMRFNF